MTSCEPSAVEHEAELPTPGEIQILNSCGIPKVAGQLRALLIAEGFDVVEVGNDSYWNYEETMVSLRNPHWPGAAKLARILKTDNIIPLENPLKMVDATIYVGKDIYKVLDYDKR